MQEKKLQMNKHFTIRVFGQVQGVFFRASTQKEAKNLNITGFAKNEPDGSVYIEAEGDPKSLNKFLKWCQNGPHWAKVDKVNIEEKPIKSYSQFNIF